MWCEKSNSGRNDHVLATSLLGRSSPNFLWQTNQQEPHPLHSHPDKKISKRIIWDFFSCHVCQLPPCLPSKLYPFESTYLSAPYRPNKSFLFHHTTFSSSFLHLLSFPMETTINVLLSNLIFALFFIRYMAGGGGGAAEVEVERMMQIFINMHSSNFIALRTKHRKCQCFAVMN